MWFGLIYNHTHSVTFIMHRLVGFSHTQDRPAPENRGTVITHALLRSDLTSANVMSKAIAPLSMFYVGVGRASKSIGQG